MIALEEGARPADAGDLSVIRALDRLQISEVATDPRGGPMWIAREHHRRPEVADLLDRTDWLVAVGTLAGIVVGFATVALEPVPGMAPVAVIEDLYVEPEARGVGVGEALMNLVLEWAGERGAGGIDALALPGDRATKNFYETHGLVARSIIVHRRLDG